MKAEVSSGLVNNLPGGFGRRLRICRETSRRLVGWAVYLVWAVAWGEDGDVGDVEG
jgi:hypothetical protein